MYHQPWDRFARKIGRDLLQLSSTDNRSMNVTLQREKGAQEGEQKQLAKHMSHSHGIQTKRYNCENKVSERQSIEVSDRHRALPRFSMNSNVSSGKQVAESSQSGLSSSEKEDSRSSADSDSESAGAETAPRSRGKLPSSSKRRKLSSSKRCFPLQAPKCQFSYEP